MTLHIQGGMKTTLVKLGFRLLSCPIISYFFDPVAPKVIRIYLNRAFEKWKNEGKIQDYQISTQRAGFLCYQINLRVFLKKEKTDKIILNAVGNLVESVLQQLNKKITKSLPS